MEQEPTPEILRPAQCPACGKASHPLGGKISLHGHGHRSRQMRGPLEWGGLPIEAVIRLQRFWCTACEASCTVGPREILTGRLYALPAIAWALALMGIVGKALAEVRRQVSPWRVVGASAAETWHAPRRWVRAVLAGRLLRCVRRVPTDWSLRKIAERVATTVAAYALPRPDPPSIEEQVFQGAVHAW
jgi:hypothetical protein